MDDSRLSTNILAQKRESLRSMLNANTAPMISFVRSLLATTHTNCLSGRALSVFSPSYREPAAAATSPPRLLPRSNFNTVPYHSCGYSSFAAVLPMSCEVAHFR